MSVADVSNESKRVSADQYYLNIAREVAGRATCIRRQFRGDRQVEADRLHRIQWIAAWHG